ncbi:Thioesterase/thiol ester dehydrase-isomerase, partial [Rhizoclosmatium globosum]
MSKTVPVGTLATSAATRDSLPSNVATLLQNYPSLVTLPVAWADQDAYNHVNNAIIIRYFESGRLAYFHHVAAHVGGSAEDFMAGKGVSVVLKRISFNYKAPITFPDTVTVGVRVDPKSIKSDRFNHECIIVSHKYGAIVGEGTCTLVAYDHDTKRKALFTDEFL